MSNYPFRRLQAELAELINNLPPESRLPSEPELARRLGVSRATLREAMRAFENRGLIRRKQGVGTFVMPHVPVIESGLEVLESIETLARRIGLTVRMGELHIQQEQADEAEAKRFQLEVGAPLTRIERIIYAENHPIAFLVDVLPADVLSPAELASGFSGSVLDFLLRRGNPPLSQSRTEICAIGATPEVARALQIQRDDVLLHFEAELYTEDGRMIDHSHSYFLPGYFRFHVVRRVNKP